MIGGFILGGGEDGAEVLIRAIGPFPDAIWGYRCVARSDARAAQRQW